MVSKPHSSIPLTNNAFNSFRIFTMGGIIRLVDRKYLTISFDYYPWEYGNGTCL